MQVLLPLPVVTTTATVLALAASSLVRPCHAQSTVDPARVDPGREVVPLHAPPADPAFGDGALWGAGTGYKARFTADTVTVIPYLGRSVAANRSLTWRTHSIEVAGELRDPSPASDRSRRAGPHRFEVVRGPVVEAWELRPDGVEQTFHLAERPTCGGDLVVCGSLHGTHLAPAVASGRAHATIGWSDAESGQPVLDYGAATLVDADGRRVALPTRWSPAGGTRVDVELRVGAAVLAAARFPVTIDPLLAPRFARVVADDEAVAAYAAEPDRGHRMVVTEWWSPSATRR